MTRSLPRDKALAALNARRWLAAGAALGCALSLLGGCSKSDPDDKPQTATTATPKPPSPGTVELKADLQQVLHLKIESVVAASGPQELVGYGRVLDPTPLAALVSDWGVARAAALASDQELERTKLLRNQGTASVRALQAAESTAERDRLAVDAIRDRLALAWGRVLARRSDLYGLVRALTAQDRLIVRVELPAGDAPPGQPQRARLMALGNPEGIFEADFLGPAPFTDPQLQGQGFLFLTGHNPLHLTPGAAVTAYLELSGKPLSGVWVPPSALIRVDTRIWVYTLHDEARFVRTPVSLGTSGPNGRLVTEGVRAGDKVVTQGAQALLSEELKPQSPLPD